jgi:hypothetical protein
MTIEIKPHHLEMIAQIDSRFFGLLFVLFAALICVLLILRLKESPKWQSWDVRCAVILRIVQILAFFAAGLWVLYSSYLLYKKEAARSAAYGCFTTTNLRVDPIPGGDGEKSLYLVTADTVLRNDTDRVVSISSYILDLYVGKTLTEAKPGFFVSEPTRKRSAPTIAWKHVSRFASIQRDFYEALEWIRDNKQPGNSEPTAISKESDIRLDTFSFLRIPAGQPWTFESKFVISASESDWIAADSFVIYDKGVAHKEGNIPATRIENIAVALRRGSEIAPKSSPAGTNPAPR